MKRTTLFALAVLSVAVAVAAGTAVAVTNPKPVEFTFTGRLLANPASNATSIASPSGRLRCPFNGRMASRLRDY